MLDFYVKTGIRFSLRDKRLFEITEVEITRVDCTRTNNRSAQDVHVMHCKIEYLKTTVRAFGLKRSNDPNSLLSTVDACRV